MSLRTYMYLTNKDFQLTCWEQKMWLVTSRISKAGERVLSKIFSKKNLKVCVCERENGRQCGTDTSHAVSLDGLILCGVHVNQKAKEQQKCMGWGFCGFSCLLVFNSVLFFLALPRCCRANCQCFGRTKKLAPLLTVGQLLFFPRVSELHAMKQVSYFQVRSLVPTQECRFCSQVLGDKHDKGQSWLLKLPAAIVVRMVQEPLQINSLQKLTSSEKGVEKRLHTRAVCEAR